MPEDKLLMTRPWQWLIGPELLWLIFYLAVLLLIRISGAPNKGMDDSLINLAYLIPLVGIPLTFALYYVPGVERNWLLLRVWIAGLFGAHYVMEKGLQAHSEQGPGVGTVYIMDMGLVLVMLVIGSIFVKIKF